MRVPCKVGHYQVSDTLIFIYMSYC